MDRKIKIALKQYFTPPASQKRDKFINSISVPKAKFIEVFLSQIGFIRKRVWLMFIICVLFAFLYVNTIEITGNIISTVSAILPLFVLCATSEIYKSCSCNMEEMELACKYNLFKITLMRLSVLGTIGFVMLLLFIAFVSKNDFGFVRNGIYLAVPYLLTCYISLWAISKYHTKEMIFITSSVCSSVSLFTAFSGSSYYFIYNIAFIHLWIFAFVVLCILFTYALIGFIKSQEELQWNFV